MGLPDLHVDLGHDGGQRRFAGTSVHERAAHFAKRPEVAGARLQLEILDDAERGMARLAASEAIE